MAGEIQLNSVTLATESGGVASIDSSVDIKGPLNASGSAPLYACRAWVNFNGTGTVAIRESGNVSSVTDGGQGIYTVNFTTAMADTNYNFVTSARASASTYLFVSPQLTYTKSTSALQIAVVSTSGVLADSSEVNVSIFR